MLQFLIVALVVAFAFCYAAWSLMPASARKWMATVLLERPLPPFVADALRPHTSAAGGCACDGCDRSVKPAAAPSSGTRPITIHRRRRQR